MRVLHFLLAALLAVNSLCVQAEALKATDQFDIKIEDKGTVGTITSAGVLITKGYLFQTDFARGAAGSSYADAARLSGLDDVLVVQDTSAAGAPTINYVSNEPNGVFRIQLATTNEVEAVTLYGGDSKHLNISKGVFIEGRVRLTPDVTGAGGALAAGDKIVFGLASNRNATLDNITTNAWFLFVNDSNIYCEADDNTTDTDDQDSGQDWASGTYVRLRVEINTDLYARFYINGVRVKTIAMTGLSANTVVQPYLEVAKAAAANKDHRFELDDLSFGQLDR